MRWLRLSRSGGQNRPVSCLEIGYELQVFAMIFSTTDPQTQVFGMIFTTTDPTTQVFAIIFTTTDKKKRIFAMIFTTTDPNTGLRDDCHNN